MMGETSKAFERRIKSGFFSSGFFNGIGLEITRMEDMLVLPNDENIYDKGHIERWTLRSGDSDYLYSIPDEKYDFLYASHILEHSRNVRTALANWGRVVKIGGHIIISVPDVALFEKKTMLPSRYDADHKFFFTEENPMYPHTHGLKALIRSVFGDTVETISCATYNTDYNPNGYDRPTGEYSIEAVLKKLDNLKTSNRKNEAFVM